MICNVKDPITGEDYSRDPRNIALKAEAYLQVDGPGGHQLLGSGS